MTEQDAVALTLYGEARGEPVDGRIAVACVLINRRHDGRWGTSFVAVCLARRQFSCWNDTDPNVDGLHDLLTCSPARRTLAVRECYWIADGVLADALRPRVGAATHYYATSMPTPPRWAAAGQFVAEIGHHRFYAGVA